MYFELILVYLYTYSINVDSLVEIRVMLTVLFNVSKVTFI